MRHHHHHGAACCSIIPPYILEAVASRGTPDQRERALRTLGIDSSLRTARLIQSLHDRPLRRTMPVAPPSQQRRVHDAQHGTGLPGALLRSEGVPSNGDVAVDEAYGGFGSTLDLFWTIYNRNSIDDAAMPLIGTVHYSQGYDNAFWNGQQMVFGDGDGQYFNRFTIAIDVIGHELAHGVTEYTANLVYQDQPGALNESMSDVFGSLVKQYSKSPRQTADQADWLIGEGLFTSQVSGVALRSMKEPGTAFDDPILGKDPQPGHMDGYYYGAADNGGVHINSGIPNRAFYLLATALGGYAWEKAGLIWYSALSDRHLSSTASFQNFADLTANHAETRFGATERDAVADAWQQVGITVQGSRQTAFVASAAAPNGLVHTLALDQAQGLWHTIREADGDWPYPWGDVQQAIRDQGNPGVGPTKFVAATAAPNGDLHLFVLDQADGLWHTIRTSNGDWPYPWGDVQQAIRDHGNPDVGPTRFVSASADLNGDVHVFVLDQANELWHTIRRANGDWPYPWGNVETALPAAVMA
jgi:Thermolysin metallopeptidase, alpha-helical domain/Thermolysin metallopeptidase, catalytic domain/Protealysin propeptide